MNSTGKKLTETNRKLVRYPQLFFEMKTDVSRAPKMAYENGEMQ